MLIILASGVILWNLNSAKIVLSRNILASTHHVLRAAAGDLHIAAEPQALQAFPKMTKRGDDLYTACLNAGLQEATDVDVNDSVGKSTRKPYYFVHTVRVAS